MAEISFVIRGEPLGWAAPGHRAVKSKKTGKAFAMAYDPQRKTKTSMRGIIQDNAPEEPFTGAIKLLIVAYLSIPESTSRVRREKMLSHEIRPTKRPDSSNVLKFYEDLLSKVVFYDDKQVVDGHTIQFYSDTPRVEITVEELP